MTTKSALRRIAVYALLIPAIPFAIIPCWALKAASAIDSDTANDVIDSDFVRRVIGDA
jgi:hypothetical protein